MHARHRHRIVAGTVHPSVASTDGAVRQIRDAGYDVHVTAGDAHMLPA